MKRFILIILSSVVLLVLACEKEKELVKTPTHYGNALLFINGESLNFNVSFVKKAVTFDSLYSISFKYYNTDGSLRKQFVCTGFSINLEKQVLNNWVHLPRRYPFTSYNTRLADGDVAGTNYYLDETNPYENYIQIIDYNEITKEVKASIQGVFYKDLSLLPYNPEPSAPDTLIINSIFHTKILD